MTTAKKGDRVRLVYCSDEWTRLRAGDEGTVSFVDDTGTVHVAWNSGSSLGLVPGEDEFEVVQQQVERFAKLLTSDQCVCGHSLPCPGDRP